MAGIGAVNLDLGGTGFDSGFLSFINAGKVANAEAAGQAAAANAEANAQIVASNNQAAMYTKLGYAAIAVAAVIFLIIIMAVIKK